MAPDEGSSKLPTEIRFEYIKSTLFRVIHADGVFGGVSPRGQIQMAIWNQRRPIPRAVVHAVNPDGSIGQELQRDSREGILREVDVSVVMDLELAKSVATWLEEKIAELDSAKDEGAPS